MKTSRKILVILAGIFVAFVVMYMALVRVHLLAYLENKNKNFKVVEVQNFDRLYFSPRWNVVIKNGREYKVEIDETGAVQKPSLEYIDGTLHCKAVQGETGTINAKITVPSLKEIKSAQGTLVRMDNYKADSLTVVLEDGGRFNGNNNQIKYFSMKTTGSALVEIVDLVE